MTKKPAYLWALLSALLSFNAQASSIQHAPEAPVIDGSATDAVWSTTQWQALSHTILGSTPTKDDFSGRYKLLWDKEKLYILAEITDDVLFDSHANPRERYWDDDCIEVFIDEDASGGDHLFTHNAFAYHVALDNQAVDMGHQHPDGSAEILILNDHVQSTWKRSETSPHVIYWELAVSLYSDSYTGAASDKPVELYAGKNIGFMLAYCDNDGSAEREHFIASKDIEPVNGDKNLGYKDASVFSVLTLEK